MNEMRPQKKPEKLQQEMRFSALDPTFDESLMMLERLGEHQAAIVRENSSKPDNRKLEYEDFLQKKPFLFAMKRISIDPSDTFDGVSQNRSSFDQLRVATETLSNRGQKHFPLDPWVKELRYGGPNGQLMGIAFRVRLDSIGAKSLFVPPFYGPDHYRSKPTNEQLLKIESAKALQAAMLEAEYIPVRYEIGRVVDNPHEALERLRGIVALGVWVSELTIVPFSPRSARMNDRFLGSDTIIRTYDLVDARFAQELLPGTMPINDPQQQDPSRQGTSLWDAS